MFSYVFIVFTVFHSFSMFFKRPTMANCYIASLYLHVKFCQLASHTSEPGSQVASRSRLSASWMTLNDQHACYHLLPIVTPWVDDMGYLSSTHVDTIRHPTSLNIPYRIIPYLSVLHQIPPDISKMIQNGKLPNPLSVANPDQSWSYGLWFVFFFWKTMENNGRYHRTTMKDIEKQWKT